MDDKFRLVFATVGQTPAAAAYTAEGSHAFDRLRDALKAGQERNPGGEAPFILHKFIVFDPITIGVLCKELVAA